MSFRRRHRWTRRFLFGLAFAVMAVPAQARPAPDVIPYLSHGIGVPKDFGVQAQGSPQVIPYLSHGILGEALKSRTATANAQPAVTPDAFERAVVSQAAAVHPDSGIPMSAGIPHPGDPFIVEPAKTSYTVEPGRSWYLESNPAPARPDDRSDRFVVGDGTPPVTTSGDDGFAIDWENGITFGLGALALMVALGLAVMYRRPRIAL